MSDELKSLYGEEMREYDKMETSEKHKFMLDKIEKDDITFINILYRKRGEFMLEYVDELERNILMIALVFRAEKIIKALLSLHRSKRKKANTSSRRKLKPFNKFHEDCTGTTALWYARAPSYENKRVEKYLLSLGLTSEGEM